MWTKLAQRIILFCLTLLISLGLSINHVTAQQVPLYWEFINVDIAVQNNGDMLVSETQKYTFTEDYKNQRYRYISLEKIDKITDISISENGQTLPIETEIKNNQLWIRWTHQLKVPESHTFVLKYRVIGGLHVDQNDAQVYWKAIFSDHQAPIKQAKIQVKIPEQVTNGINNFQSFGVPAKVRKVNAKTIEFVAQRNIEPQQELEVQVKFNRLGTDITTPKWQSSDWWSLLIFLGILLFMLFIIFRRSPESASTSSGSRRTSRGSGSRRTSYTDSTYSGGYGDGGGDGGGGGCGGGDGGGGDGGGGDGGGG
ncbi:MAG: DUF2207 domain-containing protein [Nostoc sp. EkiNYC01]|nr:DUF2207 domain-containing protein [Nostoc sp. EkiNYC01]